MSNETGQSAYVANLRSNTVSVLNTATNTVTATIPVGSSPLGVAVSPDGTRVYVANSSSNDVSVIDVATYCTVTATIPVGSGPHGVAVSPDGKTVYVANRLTNNVSLIDAATNKITNVFGPFFSPFYVAVTPDSSKVYVTGGDAAGINVVYEITAGNTSIPVGLSPRGIAIGSASGLHA
jgi:YVTN family beta-propeller protein